MVLFGCGGVVGKLADEFDDVQGSLLGAVTEHIGVAFNAVVVVDHSI
jgi:hypothetical protein